MQMFRLIIRFAKRQSRKSLKNNSLKAVEVGKSSPYFELLINKFKDVGSQSSK